MLLEVLVAGEDALVSVVDAATDEVAVETVVANGELTADVHGDDVGLRLLSLLGVASMRSSAVTGFPPLVGVGAEAEPPPPVLPEDSTRSLQLWSCTLGEVEDTSVRPFVDESGGNGQFEPHKSKYAKHTENSRMS